MNLKRLLVYTLFLCPLAAFGQVTLAPVPQLMFFDQNGKPLAFGCVFTYQSGTSTPLATFTDYTGTVQNPNPVPLNASGSANIWLQSGQPYTFAVKSQGGTDCSLGSLMYSVDGIGAGGTQLTTVIAQTSGSVSFTDQSQNQLFQITLTGDMVGLPISSVGVVSPGLITFQIKQDGVGNHIFTWPSNTIGGCTINANAASTSLQTFIWDGTNATAVSGCTIGTGPTSSFGDLYDYGLGASSGVCTDSNKKLTSSCTSVNSVTYNGQTVALGASGDVNHSAAAHSVAINEGNGALITGILLGASQILVGAGAGDPLAKTLPDCQDTGGNHLNYTAGTLTPSCGTTAPPVVSSESVTSQSGDISVTSGFTSTLITKAVTMPAAGCPCRVLASYTSYMSTSNALNGAAYVFDGSTHWATSVYNTTGSATLFGVSGTQMTDTTYSNGQVVTFTLKTLSNLANFTALKNNGVTAEASYLSLSVFTTN